MGLFDRKVNKAAISPPPAKAAAAGANSYANPNSAVNVIIRGEKVNKETS
jgi:hypothetical protein